MNNILYICPNCKKYKNNIPPNKVLDNNRFICPHCGAGLRIVKDPKYYSNTRFDINPGVRN